MANQTISPTTNFAGSTLCGDGAHNDGVVTIGAEDLGASSSATAPVLTRNAVGSWSWNRTAAGAETLFFRKAMTGIQRLGELYNAQLNGVAGAALPAKGIQLTDFFAIYSIGVVDATTATLRFGKSIFANNVALAQTDIVAATNISKTAAGDATGPYVSVVSIPAGSQVFSTDDFSQVEIELSIVLANTGTLKVFGVGFHCNFNYQ